MNSIDTEDLAKQIVPGLVAEYGRHASPEMTAAWIEDYCRDNGITLDDGAMDLLHDEVRDLAKTS